jgi:hypothetical protein
MAKNIYKRGAVLWLLALAVGWLSLQVVQSNRYVHARLNLLLHGCVFCSLAEPDTSQQITLPTNEIVWKLVYKGRSCVGYLDLSGRFVALTESAENWQAQIRKNAVIDIALFYLRWLLVAGMVIVLLVSKRKQITVSH